MQRAGRVGQAIAMQIRAVDIEPCLGALVIRAQALHHTPELCRVVHLDEMCHFVRGEVIEHVVGRQNESPGI